jgi:cytochrome P450
LADLDADPYPVLTALREHEPVTWAPALGRWLVTSRALVLDVLLAPENFTTDSEASPIRQVFDVQMLNADGDEQRRHREPFAPAFRARALRDEIEPAVRARVDALIDGLAHLGTADLRPVASRLAIGTVIDVLGLAVDDPVLVRSWYDDFASGLANVVGDPTPFERGRTTAQELRGRIAAQLATGGRPAALVERLGHELAGHAISEHELGSNVLLVLFGGIETTESMILNAAWALLTHPEQLATVRREPELIDAAVEESLRWEPAVQTCTRWATRQIEIGGATVGVGDTVECMLGGANRDPAHFEQPDDFDLRRPNAGDHVAFGWGRHLCLGLHLARLETRTLLAAMVERLPSVELDRERSQPPRGHEFRKPPALWARWNRVSG